MSEKNVTLNQENPLFTLNFRVLDFAQKTDYKEIKDRLVLWQKDVELDQDVANKDKMKATKSVSNFLKKIKQDDLKESDINALSESLFTCANFNDEKRRGEFDSKLTRSSKAGNITKVKVAEGEWKKLSKDQDQYKDNPASITLDEIGAKYALYPVSTIGIQVDSTKGTTTDDKPGVNISSSHSAKFNPENAVALQ